jgi:hypothetical protein
LMTDFHWQFLPIQECKDKDDGYRCLSSRKFTQFLSHPTSNIQASWINSSYLQQPTQGTQNRTPKTLHYLLICPVSSSVSSKYSHCKMSALFPHLGPVDFKWDS